MSLKNKADIEIVEGCQLGKSTFEYELYDRYSEYLYAVCYRYVGNKDQSKDVLQETFINIFKYIKSYDASKANVYTWMKKICINECLKFIKSSYTVLDFTNYENQDSSFKLIGFEDMNAEDILDQIANLEEPYRTVFNLFEIEGYNHFEISVKLSIQESYSRSLLHRAKKKLQFLLTDQKVKSWT